MLQLSVLVCAQVQPVVAGSAPGLTKLKVNALLEELSIKAQGRKYGQYWGDSDADGSAFAYRPGGWDNPGSGAHTAAT